jgi:L-asparagine transporter-like permease
MSRHEPSRIPNTPLLFVSVLLLGLMGPVVSFARWHDWDAMRWALKVLVWAATLATFLSLRREPGLLRWLRYVPWMALVITAFLSWIAFVKEEMTMEITVQIGWCLVVGGLFWVLRRRYPNHFSATAHPEHEPQAQPLE